jgi:hypothetical protein
MEATGIRAVGPLREVPPKHERRRSARVAPNAGSGRYSTEVPPWFFRPWCRCRPAGSRGKAAAGLPVIGSPRAVVPATRPFVAVRARRRHSAYARCRHGYAARPDSQSRSAMGPHSRVRAVLSEGVRGLPVGSAGGQGRHRIEVAATILMAWPAPRRRARPLHEADGLV